MPETKPPEEDPRRLVVYVGSDGSYWERLTQQFSSRYQKVAWKFERLDVDGDRTPYPEVAFEVLRKEPKIVFLDFTSEPREKAKLSRFLARDNSAAGVPLIGLVNDEKSVRKCLSSGVEVVHIKCGEHHDVVYDTVYLHDEEAAVTREFAKARLGGKEIDLIDDLKVGYITPDYVHIEGNLRLEEDETIVLDSAIPRKIVPSRRFVVKKSHADGLYYDFKYSYDLHFCYVDEPDNSDLDEELARAESGDPSPEEARKVRAEVMERRKDREAGHLESLRLCRERTKKWVSDNAMDSMAKFTRALVVDESLRVFRESFRYFETCPYSVRFQTRLSDDAEDLRRFRPGIVAFQHSPVDVAGLKARGKKEGEIAALVRRTFPKATERIRGWIEAIDAMEGYEPLIVVFNCADLDAELGFGRHPGLEECRVDLDHPRCILYREPMGADVVVEMMERFEKNREAKFEKAMKEKLAALRKRDPSRYRRLTPSDFKERRYYIPRSNALSFAATSHRVRLLSLTESEMEIASDVGLEMKTYRVNFPLPMAVRPVPVKGRDFVADGGARIYKCLIHSIGELRRTELRRQINDIFCAPAAETREREREAFRRLNEDRARKRSGASKKSPKNRD